MARVCRRCRKIRLVLLAALLGGGAGWLAIMLGAGRELSMFATFIGAMLPVMWNARMQATGAKRR